MCGWLVVLCGGSVVVFGMVVVLHEYLLNQVMVGAREAYGTVEKVHLASTARQDRFSGWPVSWC